MLECWTKMQECLRLYNFRSRLGIEIVSLKADFVFQLIFSSCIATICTHTNHHIIKKNSPRCTSCCRSQRMTHSPCLSFIYFKVQSYFCISSIISDATGPCSPQNLLGNYMMKVLHWCHHAKFMILMHSAYSVLLNNKNWLCSKKLSSSLTTEVYLFSSYPKLITPPTSSTHETV